MIGKHSSNNKQEKACKSFEICAELPCKIRAKHYFLILLRFHTAKSSRDYLTKYFHFSCGELTKDYNVMQRGI